MTDAIDFWDVIYNCRAMRRLKPDPVPEELLRKLIDAAQQASTGSNMQFRQWIVVRDPAQKRKLADLNREIATPYLEGQRAAIDKVPHHDAAKRTRMMDAVEWQMEHFHEMPALIVACMVYPQPPKDSFGAGAQAGSEVWPAVQSLLLAARALGLGATPTTLGLVDRAAAQRVLGLPENILPICTIPVGYPTGNFGPTSRRPLDEVLHWDRW